MGHFKKSDLWACPVGSVQVTLRAWVFPKQWFALLTWRMWGWVSPCRRWPLTFTTPLQPYPSPLLNEPDSEDPGAAVSGWRSLLVKCWQLCGAPLTQEVGRAIVLGCSGKALTSMCVFWGCAVLVTMFVDFFWWSVKFSPRMGMHGVVPSLPG